jgi:hypothetical protein
MQVLKGSESKSEAKVAEKKEDEEVDLVYFDLFEPDPTHYRQTHVNKKLSSQWKIDRLVEFTIQQGFSRERPIMVLLYRNHCMTRESTIRVHPFHRHRKTNTKPHSRALRSYSSGGARRHKACIEPRHTTVMVDRDTHGRIMEGGAIPKWGPPNTIGTGVTTS